MRADIDEMYRLEHRIGFLKNEMVSTGRFSEQKGFVFKLKYGDYYNQWFIDNFDRFKDKNPDEHFSGYYLISSYGSKEEKQKLWDKRTEIITALIKPYIDERELLNAELGKIKDKYDKYFTCMYDMPHDGGSPMTDFLEVALRMMGDDS